MILHTSRRNQILRKLRQHLSSSELALIFAADEFGATIVKYYLHIGRQALAPSDSVYAENWLEDDAMFEAVLRMAEYPPSVLAERMDHSLWGRLNFEGAIYEPMIYDHTGGYKTADWRSMPIQGFPVAPATLRDVVKALGAWGGSYSREASDIASTMNRTPRDRAKTFWAGQYALGERVLAGEDDSVLTRWRNWCKMNVLALLRDPNFEDSTSPRRSCGTRGIALCSMALTVTSWMSCVTVSRTGGVASLS